MVPCDVSLAQTEGGRTCLTGNLDATKITNGSWRTPDYWAVSLRSALRVSLWNSSSNVSPTGMSLSDIDEAFAHTFPHEAVPEVLKVASEFTVSFHVAA